MPPRPLPRHLTRAVGWVVPVGVGATVVMGGMMSTLVAPVPGPAPAVMTFSSVLFAVLLAVQVGAVLLAAQAPVAAAWLAVVAGFALLPYDLPSWVLPGVVIGAVGALWLQLRASVVRRALATWPRRAVTGPPADVAAALPTSAWRDARVIALSLGGAALVVLGLLWTAHDVREVTAFRAEAVEGVGRVVSVDDDGFSATIEVDGATVVAPVNIGEPVVGAPIAVRWSPFTGRAEIMGDDFDPVGALVWSGLGVVALVLAWRRRRHVCVLVHAGAAPTLDALSLVAHPRVDGICVTDVDGQPLGSLVRVALLVTSGADDDAAEDATHDGPELGDELLDADVAELSDAEVVARERAIIDAIADVLEDETVDLRAMLPAAAPAALVVLDDAPIDRPVLARVGDVWLTATLVGTAPTGSAPTGDGPDALPVGASASVGAHDAPTQPSEPRGLRARLHALAGRSDGLLLLPVHVVAAALVWWLISDPPAGWFEILRFSFPIGWLVASSHRPRALVRVHPRYLESRGWVWDRWIPWRDIERIGRAEGALVLRRTGAQEALVLDRPAAATWTLVRFEPDDEVARRTIEQAWVAGRAGHGPLLPGRPSLPALLGLGWLALLVAALLR